VEGQPQALQPSAFSLQPFPAVVITFDFEMAWGLRWVSRDRDYWRQYHDDRPVVKRLLEILARHELSATWATVGHLMLRAAYGDWSAFAALSPRPGWYENIPTPEQDRAGVFYAPEAVEAIVNCPVPQELACHTFTHPTIADPRCRRELVRLELRASQDVARQYGRTLRSMVFPINGAAHLDLLEELGFTSYRAMNSEWYYLGTRFATRQLRQASLLGRGLAALMRVGRLADEKLRFRPPVSAPRRVGRLWEIPHGMFLPGFAGMGRYLSAADRLAKARKGIEQAVCKAQVFTLYLHPDGFHRQSDAMFACFEQICAALAQARNAGRLRVYTMEQLADTLSAEARS
jgi:peptidoglycan/xylan/chitin deacetylase (PgdA/CDA1 family)